MELHYVFDSEGNLCKELPMFKEALEPLILNDDGTIDAPVIEHRKNSILFQVAELI